MSEEVCYSSVVFSTPYNSSAPVKNNEATVYAEVKKAELAPVKTVKTHPEQGDSRTTGQETWSPAQTPVKTEHRCQPQQGAIVFLSLTCASLLAGIIAVFVCYYLTTGQLRKDQTLLDEILQFSNFPVKQYCSKERRCSRCASGWMFNNSKCYFVDLDKPWKTWEDSRLECIKMGADLLTIQNKEEQMFIMNFAPTYYDEWHGYWIGLTGKAQDWVWINGSSLTTGFWADAGKQNGTHVLTNIDRKTLNSWRQAWPDMRNRWICENKALLL
uniref:Killer cell lectin-like receptor subfamily B member 1A n=1 Tax=Paramormyrops kingsleyae TaxID=1676925 RepID=A0A3B3SEX4_9TELE|nr:killer cell lectin-like receptor subfamily B member 1A [Paramormyrops kingsleyae]